MKKILYILSVVAICFVTSILTLAINTKIQSKDKEDDEDKRKKVLIEYGDQFPAFDYLENAYGDVVVLPELTKDYRMVIYISEGCLTCRDTVKLIDRIECVTTFCQPNNQAPQFTKAQQKIYYQRICVDGLNTKTESKEYTKSFGCGCIV